MDGVTNRCADLAHYRASSAQTSLHGGGDLLNSDMTTSTEFVEIHAIISVPSLMSAKGGG